MSVFKEFISAFKATVTPFETYVLGFSRKKGEEPTIYFHMPAQIPEELKEKLIYHSSVLLEHIGFGESGEESYTEINGSIIIACYRIVCTRCKTEIAPPLEVSGKKISAINISTDMLLY